MDGAATRRGLSLGYGTHVPAPRRRCRIWREGSAARRGYGYRPNPRCAYRPELRLLNESAVRSLEEGLEETLTLHRLGVVRALGSSLKTTNCLESLNRLVEQRVAKVDRWRSSDQTQRWLAAALLDIEPRLRRIKGFRALPLLRQALLAEVQGETGATSIQAA